MSRFLGGPWSGGYGLFRNVISKVADEVDKAFDTHFEDQCSPRVTGASHRLVRRPLKEELKAHIRERLEPTT